MQLPCDGLALPFPLLLTGHIQRLLSLLNKIKSSGSEGAGSSGGGYIDPRFRRVLWYLIGSTKGGANRARIIQLLNERPANPNQIATVLGMDYKTILHHLKVLSDNGLVITDDKDRYGATYFLTPLLEKNYQSFRDILQKVRGK